MKLTAERSKWPDGWRWSMVVEALHDELSSQRCRKASSTGAAPTSAYASQASNDSPRRNRSATATSSNPPSNPSTRASAKSVAASRLGVSPWTSTIPPRYQHRAGTCLPVRSTAAHRLAGWRSTDLHVIAGEPEPTSFIELHMVVCEIEELSHAALTAFAMTAVRLMDMSARGTLDLASAEQVARWIATVHDEYGYKAFMALVEYVRAAATEDGMVDAVIEHVKQEVRPRARCFLEERLAAELEPKLRAKGRAELLVRQLEHRFGELSAELRSRIEAAGIRELDHWGLRLVSVATLDEIFAEDPPRRRSKRRRHRGKRPQPSPR